MNDYKSNREIIDEYVYKEKIEQAKRDGHFLERRKLKEKPLIVVTCRRTKRTHIFEHQFWQPPILQLKQYCPACGKLIKIGKGRPQKYTKLEQDLLDICHHKFVQDVLKKEVFGSDLGTLKKLLERYGKKHAGSNIPEFRHDCRVILFAIRRYITRCEFEYRGHQLKYLHINKEPAIQSDYDSGQFFEDY